MATPVNGSVFISGANAKIKVGGKTWAYASDVSYQVVVDTIPVETMGRYEAVANEPVNYSVAGELSVVRYSKIAQDTGKLSTGQKTSTTGNGIGQAGYSSHFDPASMMSSSTFNLEIYQKNQQVQVGETNAGEIITNSIIKITDCRFTRKSAALNKRAILVDRFSFVGILASDDSFTAGNSGDKDLEV